MTDLLIIVTAILIVAILADGIRRAHLGRRDKIRVSRKVYKQQSLRDEPAASQDLYSSELPNGGARVVNTREPVVSARPATRDSRKPADANEPVPPTLMEPVEDVLMKGRQDDDYDYPSAPVSNRPPVMEERMPVEERIEPGFFSEAVPNQAEEPGGYDSCQEDETLIRSHRRYQEPEQEELPYEDEDSHYDEEQDDYDEEDYDEEDYEAFDEGEDYPDDDYDNEEDDAGEEAALPEDPSDPLSRPAASRALTEPEEVLIINIMAPRGTVFAGEDLLDSLLKAGLRFGDMNIFHRYSDIKGDGELLFSMANMVKPGHFDLEAMDEFETPGVSLFMTLPLRADSMKSYDLMVDTAREIAEALGGELKDEQHSVLTRQTIDHCRERIRDFERRRLFSRQRRD